MVRYNWIALVLLCSLGSAWADNIELNPLDYVPLAVGNRWTYEHVYQNHLHEEGYPFDIPGYPLGEPPDSLTSVIKTVTIEITHTEVIDGLEYFVFSDPDYTWPPLSYFFWGGKKVRLSDEGFLVFRGHEQDIPVYDFGQPHLGYSYEYMGAFPRGASTEEVRFERVYAQYWRSRVHFKLSDIGHIAGSIIGHNAGTIFLQEYGIGQAYIEAFSWGWERPFFNELMPISATILGEEIVYEQVYPSYDSFKSTELGQVGRVRMNEGFDFSEGKHSEPSNDFELVKRHRDLFSGSSVPIGKATDQPLLWETWSALSSETGIADLGKGDFGHLIAIVKSISPDFQLHFGTEANLSKGHTYAVRSREGGIALMYLLDWEPRTTDFKGGVTYFAGSFINSIKFDWVYYPDGLPAVGTSIQSTSWGQLKNSVFGTK